MHNDGFNQVVFEFAVHFQLPDFMQRKEIKNEENNNVANLNENEITIK